MQINRCAKVRALARAKFLCLNLEICREKFMLTIGNPNLLAKMHDSSAMHRAAERAKLLFAVAGRTHLAHQSNDAGFPRLAIQACLDFAKVTTAQIDEVCFGWQTAGPVYPS